AYGMMKEKYPEASEEEIWDKIALIDTEHERSLVYEGVSVGDTKIGQFLFVMLDAPYSLSRYEAAVKAAKGAGAEVVVIDSISHAWEAEGGLLDVQQDKGGNFQAWREVNPIYAKFIDLVTGVTFKIHTLSTMRTKQEYHVGATETGKLTVQKLGLKTVQRDSLEYELQLVFNIDMDHIARPAKDNTLGMFDRHQVINAEYGHKLIKWLEKGEDVKGKIEQERKEFISMCEELSHYSEPVGNKLKDLEKLAKKPVTEFDRVLAERAYGILQTLINELETVPAQ
ncbi:MAG: AAA family ATPase, partial [Bacillus sp. (in: firmicutes)]